MPRKMLATDVFDAAVVRLLRLYQEGHRLVVSFSGGKDSTVLLETAIIAATSAGRLPVEVIMRDDEIAFPGTIEFCERTYRRPEVKMTWLVQNQPVINIFNRKAPYWWVFDPQLTPDKWVCQPPEFATYEKTLCIDAMTIPDRFPPPEGKNLYACIGLRTQESRGRFFGLFSSGGYVTKPNKYGVRNARPIYDWSDSDVWRGIKENGWDYNHAYDTFFSMGVKAKGLRIGPPTMTSGGIKLLMLAAKAWPVWFDKVCERCPGVRTAAMFGDRAITPNRRLGESWEATFQRECIDRAPEWIAERAKKCRDSVISAHTRHATTPLPEADSCVTCGGNIGSWKNLTTIMFAGDPFSLKTSWILPYVEPEYFRAGSGTWGGGKASW